ncbi:MAG: hypothetical protein AAFS02_02315 [Pseudomonadota bacterium]
MSGRFKAITDACRELGVADTLLYATDRLLGKLPGRFRIHCHHLVVQPVPDAAALPQRLLDQIAVEDLSTDPDALNALPVPKPVLEDRLRQGSTCVGVTRKGVLLGYGWLALEAYEDDEFRVDYRLPAGIAAFDLDVFVFEQYRGLRSFAYLWEGLNRELRRRAITTTYSRISRFNSASIRSHTRMGARLIGTLTVLQLGRLEYTVTRIDGRRRLTMSRRQRHSIDMAPA